MKKYWPAIRFSLASFFIGLAAVPFFWVTYLFLDEQPFNKEGLLKIHENNSGLYVLDLLPFLVAVGAWYIYGKTSLQIKNLQKKIETIKEDIEEKAALAKKIGESGLESAPVEFSEEDVLGKALTEMQKALAEARKKDAEAQWVAEALAELSDILRNHQTVRGLAGEVTAFLLEKVRAASIQFYAISDNQSQMAKLVSSLSDDNDELIEKEVHPGRGAAGLALQELEVYHAAKGQSQAQKLKTQDAASSARNQLYLPLLSEGLIYGVMAIRPIHKFELPALRFLLQCGEIIGRTLFNIRVNENTVRLLEESRKLSRELEQQREKLIIHQEQLSKTGEVLKITNTALENKITEVENSQKKLKLLLENASEITTIFDAEKKIVFISPSVKRILGYEPSELAGKVGFPSEHAQGIPELEALFTRVLDDPGVAITAEFSVLSNTGKRIWMENTAINLIHDAAIQGIVLNSKDITMRRRAELERRRRDQMQSLSENSPDLIIRLNKLGVFFYVNPIIEKFTSCKPEHYLNKYLNATGLPESFSELLEKLLYEAVGTAHKVFSETWFHEGNTKVYLAITAIPEYNEQKEVDSVLFVAHDITDQKLAEAEIRRKNTSITESIRYSQSIQSSLMPTDRVFRTFLGDSFLFYQPRDIISGDFPWIFRQNQYLYMAIADCTGHGVPGALLSLVGYFQLNNVVEKNIGASCGVILDQLNQRVREILRQDSGESMTKDGMDIALLRWDTRSQELEFSGAHRPLLYLDEQGQLCEIRGDRTPIAGFQRKQAQPFSTHRVQCTGKEKFFLFTDGLPDQFGGEGGKEKLMMARIRETIEAHRHESAATIGNHLRELYFHWMGNTRQIDDVLLLSFSMSPSQNFLN